MRKQIVHNLHVVRALEARGAIFVDETDEVPEGATVVFSAHGVAPVVHEEAAARNLRTIDATCPLVTKVHNEARRFAREDYDILLIGHEGHEEVVGTAGEAPEPSTLVDGPADAATVQVKDPDKVVWLSQTTLSVDETLETVRRAGGAVPDADSPAERRHLLRHAEPAGRGQGDRRRAPICSWWSARPTRPTRCGWSRSPATHGARAAHLVDDATAIDATWLDGVGTVGLSSGASVPEILVTDVLAWLAERGYGEVEEVNAADEKQSLRAAARAAPPRRRRLASRRRRCAYASAPSAGAKT